MNYDVQSRLAGSKCLCECHLCHVKNNGPQVNVFLVSLVCLSNRKGLKITQQVQGRQQFPLLSMAFQDISDI